MFGPSKKVSILASIRALRAKMASPETSIASQSTVERLEERRFLSVTMANMATPDGMNHVYEGGIGFNLVLTGQTSSGNPTLWNIDFGDGTTMNNIEGPGDGSSTVTISHAFSTSDEEGDAHSVTAQVTELSGSSSIYPVTTVLNTVDASLTASGASFSVTEGESFSSVTVAYLQDANLAAPASDFSGTIDWGDGTGASVAEFQSLGSGQFAVLGSHEYDSSANFSPTVTVNDVGGSSATTTTGLATSKKLTLTSDAPNNTVTLHKTGGNALVNITTSRPNVAIDATSGSKYSYKIQRQTSTKLLMTFTPVVNAPQGTEICTITPIGDNGTPLTDAVLKLKIVLAP